MSVTQQMGVFQQPARAHVKDAFPAARITNRMPDKQDEA
jgi:hypothetical protein